MSKRLQWILLALIMVAAAYLRFTGLDWDEYNHYHPDERFISWVGTTIEVPDDWSNALNPHKTTFNPFYWPENAESKGIVVDQDQQRRFAYGHLPLYAGVAASKITNRLGPTISSILPENTILAGDILNGNNLIEYRQLTAAGRALTALVDTLSVGLVFILGKLLFGPKTGLLASAFLAFNVLHIQLAHFFTVDPYLTFFSLASLTFMVLSARTSLTAGKRFLFLALAAAAAGLAIGAKFNGLLLLLPLAITVALSLRRSILHKILIFLVLVGIVVLLFAVTNPFAILDFSCDAPSPAFEIGPLKISSFNIRSCYLMNIGLQGSMVRGIRDVPFVRQYAGTLPFLYQIEMQLKWGMGLALGAAAFIGLAWAAWRSALATRTWWRSKDDSEGQTLEPVRYGPNAPAVTSSEIIVLAWTLPYFLFTGLLTVKFMRYMQPIVPIMMVYAAAMLISIPSVKLRRGLTGLVLLATMLYAVSFTSIYRQPHPWIEASRWIYAQIEPGSKIVSEVWDDSLPDNLADENSVLKNNVYQSEEINWLSRVGSLDDQDKLYRNLEKVAESDLLVIASNRNYGVISRLEEIYPLSSQYYPLLFDGSLGYELVFINTRMPNILGLNLTADPFTWPDLDPPTLAEEYLANSLGLNIGRFDESFTVYDQPLTMVFKNQGRLTAEEMAEMFNIPEGADLPSDE